jgi:DNA-binding CsgD family transcriptional regulator
LKGVPLPIEATLLLDLIGEIYEAAKAPDAWRLFLEHLLGTAKGVAAGFHVHDVASNSGNVLVDVGGDAAYVQKYREYYAGINPWSKSNARQMQDGQVFVGLAKRDLEGSEYYEDFWRPQGFNDSLNACVVRDGSIRGALIAIRAVGAPEFGTEEIRLFQILAPHLMRAVQLQGFLERAVSTRDALLDALNRVSYGVIVIDDKHKVLAINASAQMVVDERDGLLLDADELCATDKRTQPDFHRAVQGAIATTLGVGFGAGRSLELPRRTRDRPLSVTVSPLGVATSALQQPKPAAVVLLSADPDRVSIREDTLADLYDLTPTEARVATALALGKDIDGISSGWQVSINTVKTHLKRIFDKTGTHRQGELIALLLTSIASLRDSDQK